MGRTHQILVGLRCRALALTTAVLLVGIASAAAAELTLLGVRFGEHAKKTRVVFDLSGPIRYSAFTLSAPNRVVVDMRSVVSRIGDRKRARTGFVLGYRFGKSSENASRLVLDVAGPVRIDRSFLLPPDDQYGHRLVIDIRKSRVQPAAAVQPKSAKPNHGSLRPKTPLPLRNPNRRPQPHVIATAPGAASGRAIGAKKTTSAEPSLLGVRFGEHSEKTRIVFDLSALTAFNAVALGDPDRVVIDMRPMTSRIANTQKATSGLVLGYRFSKLSQTESRLVLNLAGPVRIEQSFLLPPDDSYGHRLVIDIRKSPVQVAKAVRRSEVSVPVTAPPNPVERTRRTSQSAAVPLPIPHPFRRHRRLLSVVIDPGHGGNDPGTIGVNGVYEKNITLRFAQALRTAFNNKGGYRVSLTRGNDVYVRLRDRIAIAREVSADLFISLHADSLGDSSIRGASVYTLSETASDNEAAALAAKENRSDIIAGVDLTSQNDDVTSILIDLTQRETMNRSARYANQVLTEIRKSARVLRKSHRFGGFAVLKAPDVPSVLVELGYLSNPRDVRFLSSMKGRAVIVGAIVRATEAFFRKERK